MNRPISSISIRLREHRVPSDGHQRGADHDAEGVAGDQEAGGRDGDPEVAGDLGQQAHDHELGGSDAEGPDRESQQREQAW